MKDRIFIDTNILIYSLTIPEDDKDTYKRNLSFDLIKNSISDKEMIVSTQIINELHFNMMKKFKIQDDNIVNIINQNIVTVFKISPVTLNTYLLAYDLRSKYNFSFWDSIVVFSALENNCIKLYSEDMQSGIVVNNCLTIINPIKAESL